MRKQPKIIEKEVSWSKEWRSIKRVLSGHKQHTGSALDLELRKLEPIEAVNRVRAAEALTKKLHTRAAIKLLDRGKLYGEDNPLADFERGYALYVGGPEREALREAKRAFAKWKFSHNLYLVGLIYWSMGQKKKGERLIDRAGRLAERELKADKYERFPAYPKSAQATAKFRIVWKKRTKPGPRKKPSSR